MVSNSQVRIENADLKAEVLKLQKQLEVEKTKRGKQVLRAEWNRAFAEEEFWDKFMQVCPEYRNKFFDRLHSLQYCRSYKGRTAEEWHEYWQRRLERITDYRRQFNAARRKRAACK